MHACFQRFKDTFDDVYGGFSPAPKFPTPSILNFLLRYHALEKPTPISDDELETIPLPELRALLANQERPAEEDESRSDLVKEYREQLERRARPPQDAIDMTLITLRKMAQGGMHDHISKGFHRYSTDKRWHVPQ